jgi:predicted nucleic acid-binding protein
MMFAYVLGDHREFAPHVRRTLTRSRQRGDTLMTSCLAAGEVMVGGQQRDRTPDEIETLIRQMGFLLLPFDESCMAVFARLRAESRLKAPDAIHLACAAAAGTDLFLTNDDQLLKRHLQVPGIQFIADFTLPIL